MVSLRLLTSGLPIKISKVYHFSDPFVVFEANNIARTIGSKMTQSTPFWSNAVGLTLDNPIDFAFSPRLNNVIGRFCDPTNLTWAFYKSLSKNKPMNKI